MANPEGEPENQPLRLVFDRRLGLEFYGSRVISDAELLAYLDLDDMSWFKTYETLGHSGLLVVQGMEK